MPEEIIALLLHLEPAHGLLQILPRVGGAPASELLGLEGQPVEDLDAEEGGAADGFLEAAFEDRVEDALHPGVSFAGFDGVEGLAVGEVANDVEGEPVKPMGL